MYKKSFYTFAFSVLVALLSAGSPLFAQDLLWVKATGSTIDWDVPAAITRDTDGNVYVTGEFAGTINLGGISLTSAGSLDIFMVKFDPSGNAIWAKCMGGSGYDGGYDIAVTAELQRDR